MLPGVSGAALLGTGKAKLPVFVGAATANDTNTNGLTVAKPAGVAAGMLLVAICFGMNVGSAPSLSGWTLVYNGAPSGTSSLTIFTKIAGESEPANYSFSGGPTGRATAHILAYTHGTLDVVGAKTESSGLIATAASITATKRGLLLSAFGVEYTSKVVNTPPVGMTARSSFNASSPSVMVYELSPSPSGVTGDKTLTWTSGGGSSDTAQNAAVSLQIH